MNRNTPTPSTDTVALMMALIASSDIGEVTVRILAGMYPDPVALTN